MPRVVTERADAVQAVAEVFREHGFAGATLATISTGASLGKGSLYHFFPGGKEEMASAVLDDVGRWFRENVIAPLGTDEDPRMLADHMFDAVDRYFQSGERVCLFGAFALGQERDRFARPVETYFTNWVRALQRLLHRAGVTEKEARDTAEEVVAGIQGALVLTRAQQDPAVFSRLLERSRRRVDRVLGDSLA